MSVINTNYLALVSQNNLTKSQNALGTAIERLSSGLRINSAKDDAAGQAIANRFTANIKGLTQAGRNANDGISIAQTTEGALNEINNNLQRIRELSVQAANGSNSQSDLDSIQAEIQQRLGEIDRVSEQTQFNSVRVLAGDRESLTIQVGAQDNETISINLSKIDAESLGLGSFNIARPQLDVAGLGSELTNLTDAVPDTPQSVPLTFEDKNAAAVTEGKVYVKTDDPDTLVYVQGGKAYDFDSYDAATGTLSFATTESTTIADWSAVSGDYTEATEGTEVVADASTGTTVTIGSIAIEGGEDPATTAEYYVDADGQLYVSLDGGATAWKGDLGDGGVVTIDTSDATSEVDATAFATLEKSAVLDTYDYVEEGTDAVPYDLSAVTAELGADAKLFQLENGDFVLQGKNEAGDTVYFAAEVDGADVTIKQSDAGENIQYSTELKPLDALDKALQQVDNLRSDLGAIQNRFQSTIANLANTVNNLSAARSRIEDADYAVEVSNMTRAQILQQAGTSVLAQANQVPQTVLSLLR